MLKIEFTPERLQAICAVLANRPFKQVALWLQDIQTQVNSQQIVQNGLQAKKELDTERMKQGDGSAKQSNGSAVSPAA